MEDVWYPLKLLKYLNLQIDSLEVANKRLKKMLFMFENCGIHN